MTPQYGPPGFEGRCTKGRFASSFAGFPMTDGPRDNGRHGPRPDEEALSARLRSLGERLGQVKASRRPEGESGARPPSDMTGIGRGLRLSAEFVGGVVVGAMIGWLLDRWLGTSPWGLFAFLMLGFAAGIRNVLRSAGTGSNSPDSAARNND